ncbi:MAG: hypothetical protein AAF360_01930 [Pseudomonadota bacterium]
MFYLFGAVFVGGLTGYLSERLGFTRNGFIVSIALGVGGAVSLWFIQAFIGIGLGLGRALTSVVGAAGLLFLASMRR